MKFLVSFVILISILGIGIANAKKWKHNSKASKAGSSEEIFRKPIPKKDPWFNTIKNRLLIIDHEDSLRLGGDLPDKFTVKQKKVNDILMKLRKKEMDDGQKDVYHYAPGMHFFKAKDLIENSKVYKFIKKMPKGALLQGYNRAMVSSDWFLNNVTYRDGLRMCKYKKSKILTFKKTDTRCEDDLVLVADERNKETDKKKFDKKLRKVFDLYTPTPELDYPYNGDAWIKVRLISESIDDSISYYSVFKDYHYQLLQELYDDNIMYAELRTSFGELYDDTGKVYTIDETIQLLQSVITDFKKTHCNFADVKFIYSVDRSVSLTTMQSEIDLYKKLYKKYPLFIIGFDITGEEDNGHTIIDYLDQINTFPADVKFYFHAGETDWYGTPADQNLLDALLLRTQRVGHGFSLNKHPTLWKHVKKSNIAIEVSPISNQVLGLVWDLRNHPAVQFMSENIPVVISSASPGYWQASGLSYDHYYALMTFAPYEAGLEVSWQLAYNSIKFSTLTTTERTKYEKMYFAQWDKFYDDVIAGRVV